MVSWPSFGRQESVHDYVGVLVPLERAHLYSYSSRGGKQEPQNEDAVLDDDIEARLNSVERRRSQDDDEDDLEMDEQKEEEDNEAQGMLRPREKSDSEYSIENLKAEMRQGTGGGGPHGRWTTYESKACNMENARMAFYTDDSSQIKTYEQGRSRYWHGFVQLAALCRLWVRMVCRQVSCQRLLPF